MWLVEQQSTNNLPINFEISFLLMCMSCTKDFDLNWIERKKIFFSSKLENTFTCCSSVNVCMWYDNDRGHWESLCSCVCVCVWYELEREREKKGHKNLWPSSSSKRKFFFCIFFRFFKLFFSCYSRTTKKNQIRHLVHIVGLLACRFGVSRYLTLCFFFVLLFPYTCTRTISAYIHLI